MPNTVAGATDIGLRAQSLVKEVTVFNHPQRIISLHPFTITDSGTVTKAIASVNGRPGFNQTPTTSTATDGTNFMHGVASVILQQGKVLRLFGSFNGADIVNQEFLFCLGVVGTGIIATPPTDFIGFRKLTTVTRPSFVCRKASGTAQDTAIPLPVALANSTWYDWEIVCKSDASVAGQGTADVYFGPSVAAGAQIPQLAANIPIATQFPDTVAMALGCGARLGSTTNATFTTGHIGYELLGV